MIYNILKNMQRNIFALLFHMLIAIVSELSNNQLFIHKKIDIVYVNVNKYMYICIYI